MVIAAVVVITVSLKSPDLQITGQMVSEVLLALKCLQFNGSMIPGFYASIILRFYCSKILRLQGSKEPLWLTLRCYGSPFWGCCEGSHCFLRASRVPAPGSHFSRWISPNIECVAVTMSEWRWGNGSTERWSHLLSPFLGDPFWDEMIPSFPHCSEMLYHTLNASSLSHLVLYILLFYPFHLSNFLFSNDFFWNNSCMEI